MRRGRGLALLCGLGLMVLAGCGGPSQDERENRKSFEFLLTAITLKNAGELERDVRLINDRHSAGSLSDDHHRELLEIVAQARSGDWGQAESRAYDWREKHPFFK